MADLAKSSDPVFGSLPGLLPPRSAGLTAAAPVYRGSYLSFPADGYLNQANAAETFGGIALENATGGASDGTVECLISEHGLVKANVTGVDGIDDHGKVIYASDGGTLTLTDAGSLPVVGRVAAHISGTLCWVHYYTASTGLQ